MSGSGTLEPHSGLTTGRVGDIIIENTVNIGQLCKAARRINMKRIVSAVTAVIMASALFTACGSKSSSESSKKNIRVEGTAQEALEEVFYLTYTKGSVDKSYEYMYPLGMLDQLKSNGSYKSLKDRFERAQDKMVNDMKQSPEFKEITDTIEMNESQLAASARYFSDAASQFGITVDPANIKITKGYELHYDFVDYNGKEDSDDNECMVYIENDGWKNIFFSAAGIEERFPEGQSGTSSETFSQAAT